MKLQLKITGQLAVMVSALLMLNGCIAYPIIGYRKYTPEFTGKVTTRDGKPVSGMAVKVRCYNRIWKGETDGKGGFRVPAMGHWYYFVFESLKGIEIYPKQIDVPATYDFSFYFGKENEKYFKIGALHDSPYDGLFYHIPTFYGFVGFDLLTCRYVDPKIQDMEFKKKKQECISDKLLSKSRDLSDFQRMLSGRKIYYRKTYLLLKKEDLKDFKVVTDDYVLTLDEALLNYLFEFSRFSSSEIGHSRSK